MNTTANEVPATIRRWIDVDGIRTHYLEQGEGEPVVLIHGGGAGADSWGNWRGVIPALGDDLRIIALDMVGFGHTDKPNGNFEYSQSARNRHLAGFLDALGLSGIALVGNSMGGATALGVAVERPELVSSLVLMGSAGLNTSVHEDLKPVVNYDFSREGMVTIVRQLTTPDFVIEDSLIDYRYALATDPETRRAYAATMAWIREQNGLHYDEDYISRVSQRTLVVQGKLDKVIPVESGYRFLKLIPQSWGYIVPNCGHWAMIEHPVEFARVTGEFLRS